MNLLTVGETAEMLRVSPLTVRRYIAGGRLSIVRVGRNIRIDREEIDRLLGVSDRARPEQGTKPVRQAPEVKSPKRVTWEPTSDDDPLWEIVGIASIDGPTDLARNKHHYLTETYGDKHR